MHTRTQTETYILYTGNAFLDEVHEKLPIVVQGDLICKDVTAPSIEVYHGSLIAAAIYCPFVHADIFGIYDLTKPYNGPVTYEWLRPVLPGYEPTEGAPTNIDSIVNAVSILTEPALVGTATAALRFAERAVARPSCGRARVLIAAGVEVLMHEEPELLTPLGRQVFGCVMRHERLPVDWRF